jgi:methionine-rich copper-binding protein CopC
MKKKFPLNTATARLSSLTVVACAVVLGISAPAQAHDFLVGSTPTEGEVVSSLPAAFSVTTDSPLMTLDGGTSGYALVVKDSAGLYYGDGCLTIAGATLSSGASLGEAGDYTLLWQVISDDGHPASGEVAFSWQPADASEVTPGSVTPPDCGGTVTAPPVAEEPAATPVPISGDASQPAVDLSTVLWIAGGIAAVLVAALATIVILRRRSNDPARPDEGPDSDERR